MSRSEIETLLKGSMGLEAASIGTAAVEHAIAQRMSQTQLEDIAEYTAKLRASREEMQNLIEAVVVPETSFFRHPESFQALQRLATHEWLGKTSPHAIKILSVPSSTGEEPYSIVMALLDAHVPEERFVVDAIDISRQALSHARHGTYGKNSFRGSDLTYKARYFHPAEGGYRINNRVRDKVSFRQGNVLDLQSTIVGTQYDVLFCRNLLIYFDRPTQERILSILKGLLASEGTMFVGPAEALLMRGAGFAPTSDAMAFAFRPATAAKAGVPRPAFTPPAPAPVLPARKPTIAAPVAKSVAALATPPAAPRVDLNEAKRMADSGNFQGAINICEAHLKAHGDNAEAHYLLGLIYDAQGDGIKAANNYRKALYLDPNHFEAITHWALLAERQGDIAGAKRLQERARRLGAGTAS